jgi:hypothetical protein
VSDVRLILAARLNLLAVAHFPKLQRDNSKKQELP